MARVPLELPPGIVKTESDTSQEGRYIDGDKVRFVRQRPEKIGGYEKWSHDLISGGNARGLFGWSDDANNIYVAVGTACKLLVLQSPPSDDPGTVDSGWGDGGWGENGWGEVVAVAGTVTDFQDITPIRLSGNLTNPFTMTLGSNTVLVTHASHGLSIGDTAIFSGADPVGEITIGGDYLVVTTPTPDTYTIEHPFLATFNESGGGTVAYEYEIPCGEEDTSVGLGWGIGGWGVGTWNTPRDTFVFVQLPRFWSLGKYNNNLLAMPSGGRPYMWTPASGGRALPIANAPDNNFAMFLTHEAYLFLLGADGNPMKVQWPDQDNLTLWTPAATNTANSRVLREGNSLVGGAAFGNDISLVWSDTALYTFTFRGLGSVYQSRIAGKKCGLIGPQAFTIADNRAFWMSSHSFHTYSGFVRDVGKVEDIRDWVFDNLTEAQKSKATCGFVAQFREVWWIYPAASSLEPNYYIGVNIDTFDWIVGTVDRTSFFLFDINDNRPLMTGSDGYIYIHETGIDADGAAMESFLEHAPMDIGEGEVTMDVMGYVPNFQRHSGSIQVTMEGREEPDAPVSDTQTKTVEPGDKIVDFRVSGRHVGIKILSNIVGGDYRQGKPLIEVEGAGERR